MAFWHALNGFVIGSLGLKSKLYFESYIELLLDEPEWVVAAEIKSAEHAKTENDITNSMPLTK